MHSLNSSSQCWRQRSWHSRSLDPSARAWAAKAADRKVPICSDVSKVFLTFTFFPPDGWRSRGLRDADSLGGQRAPPAEEAAERVDERPRELAGLGRAGGQVLGQREAGRARRRLRHLQ